MKRCNKKQNPQNKEESAFLYSRKHIKNPAEKITILISAFLGAVFLYLSGIGCVWRYFFKIPCPGCGITHALIAFFKGHFKEAFEYNYMFISVPFIVMYILYDGRLFKSKKADLFLLILISIGFLIHWIIEII